VSRLYLMRHAQAGPTQPGARDFDRPLDVSGLAQARSIGLAMRDRGYVPKLTLCSTARRTRETLETIGTQVDLGRVLIFDQLYDGGTAAYLQLIQEYGDVSDLLVIGHNPTMEYLAATLPAVTSNEAQDRRRAGFPTAALAVIDFDGDLTDLQPSTGRLTAFLFPAD
jgi:phosphohistidine phosphatase